jgi:ATP-dependent DNA helicase RecQ
MTAPFQAFLQRCVSLDLEVDPATATIFAFAAVRDDACSPILAKISWRPLTVWKQS